MLYFHDFDEIQEIVFLGIMGIKSFALIGLDTFWYVSETGLYFV